jgi:hypothetical protein
MRNIAARLAKLEKAVGAVRKPTFRFLFCEGEETSAEAQARHIAQHPKDVDATFVVVSWLSPGQERAA